MMHKGYLSVTDRGEIITVCDKTCECKKDEKKQPRAFSVVSKSTAEARWEGVRFSDGSGVIRYIDEKGSGIEAGHTLVRNVDKYLSQNGMDGTSVSYYKTKWHD